MQLIFITKKRFLVFFLLLFSIFFLFACSSNLSHSPAPKSIEKNNKKEISEVPTFITNASITTGDTASTSDSHPFIVSVENSVASRPHSGLYKADIVWEMEVEYGITRFLAVFNDELPDKVGPVRSARHYFLPIIKQMNAPFYHFGGSKFAYNEIAEEKLVTFDGTKTYA